MRSSSRIALLLAFVLLVPSVMPARHNMIISRKYSHHSHSHHHRVRRQLRIEDATVVNPNLYRERQVGKKRRGADTVQVVGSSLPDCSHACGSCSPCKLVMVSFVCATLQEAETCPMAYKCMCKNKAYPVP